MDHRRQNRRRFAAQDTWSLALVLAFASLLLPTTSCQRDKEKATPTNKKGNGSKEASPPAAPALPAPNPPAAPPPTAGWRELVNQCTLLTGLRPKGLVGSMENSEDERNPLVRKYTILHDKVGKSPVGSISLADLCSLGCIGKELNVALVAAMNDYQTAKKTLSEEQADAQLDQINRNIRKVLETKVTREDLPFLLCVLCYSNPRTGGIFSDLYMLVIRSGGSETIQAAIQQELKGGPNGGTDQVLALVLVALNTSYTGDRFAEILSEACGAHGDPRALPVLAGLYGCEGLYRVQHLAKAIADIDPRGEYMSGYFAESEKAVTDWQRDARSDEFPAWALSDRKLRQALEGFQRKRQPVWVPAAVAAAPSVHPGAQPSPRPAKELILDLGNKVTMKLVQIPAGKFLMGSPDEEKKAAVKEAVATGIPEATASDAFKDEVQHEVTISKPFYMGITHVTVNQFAAFVKDSGYKTDAEKRGWSFGMEIKDGKFDFKMMDGCSWRNPSFDQKGDHPVVQVSWNDAKAFCEWLSRKSGKTVVLPTEAQWEYACRAGTKTAYPWGDEPDAGKGWANCADQSLKKKLPNAPAELMFFSWDDGSVFTSPVGSFKANAFGLCDMTGNAWQWCQDGYGDYEKGAATDPTGADTGRLRVLRGGSWYVSPMGSRSAGRYEIIPGSRFDIGGFRVAVLSGVGGPSPSSQPAAQASPQPAAQPSTPPAKQPSTQPAMTMDLGNKVTLKLVQIPAGKFLMGSPNEEQVRFRKDAIAAGVPAAEAADWFKDETQHEVTISKPFYMGITHVTVDQFAAFVKDSGYKTDAEKDGWSFGFEIKDGTIDYKNMDGCSWRNPSFDQKGDHPVVQVSWNDAKAFCEWLSKKSGKTVVLPTEAQWEYGCRAGAKTAYPWGDDPDAGKGWANAADQSLKKKLPNAPAAWTFFSWDDGFVFTSPVGSFKANAFGLYDMTGNAWQWCQDRYGDYEKGAATDPTGADTGSLRVLRGSSWDLDPMYCRSALRGWGIPDGRITGGGAFRVAVLAVGVD